MPAPVIRPKPHGFISKLGGANWAQTQFVNRLIGDVVWNGSQFLVAASTSGPNDTSFYKASDGQSWILNPGFSQRVQDRMIQRPGNIIEIFNYPDALSNVFRSPDNGVTWGLVTGPPFTSGFVHYNPNVDLAFVITNAGQFDQPDAIGTNHNLSKTPSYTEPGDLVYSEPLVSPAPASNSGWTQRFGAGKEMFQQNPNRQYFYKNAWETILDTRDIGYGNTNINGGATIGDWTSEYSPARSAAGISGNSNVELVLAGIGVPYVWIRIQQQFGSFDRIWYRSSDGVNFSQISTEGAPVEPFDDIAIGTTVYEPTRVFYNSTLGEYVMLRRSGGLYFSNDALTWTQEDLSTLVVGIEFYDLWDIAYDPGSDIYVITARNRFLPNTNSIIITGNRN